MKQAISVVLIVLVTGCSSNRHVGDALIESGHEGFFAQRADAPLSQIDPMLRVNEARTRAVSKDAA